MIVKAMAGVFHFVKTDPAAPAPIKAHPDDTGYDLHLVHKVKTQGVVSWYDTGIAVRPPPGLYFEVVGRSSISKSGYMLANSVGIIDQGYRGSILVALVKVDPAAPELQLPCRLVQLLPRQFIHLQPREVSILDDTTRGTGAFGSTGTGPVVEADMDDLDRLAMEAERLNGGK